jgi:hypothetical protein
MEKTLKPQSKVPEKEAMVVTNYCVNTNRTYIYEIKDGEIINEKMIQGSP